MEEFCSEILSFLARPGYSPMRRRELARAVHAAGDKYALYREAIDQLERRGLVTIGRGRRYALTERSGHVRGRIEVKGGGYGFLQPQEPGSRDLFVPSGSLGGAMGGDLVLAAVVRGKGRRQGGERGPTARVLKVLERARSRLAGVFVSARGGGVVVPDRPGSPDVWIRSGDLMGAADGQKVSVEITRYPGAERSPEGRVVGILGEAGTWQAERASRLEGLGLSAEFPEEVEREATELAGGLSASELRRRADHSGETSVTIDPEDARDHDDAIRVVREADGWQLRVHIADVSLYVRPGTALDKEARSRGASVYIPGEVFRMLPDRLSSDLCSLREGELRPALTVSMRFDAEGNMKRGATVERSVIRSTVRLTYAQVRRAFGDEDEGGAERSRDIPGHVLAMLRDARELHEKLRTLRMREGALDLSFPEIGLVLGPDGRVAAVERKFQDFSHHMIEEFMLAANRTVAEVLAERGLPGIYRIHEEPDERALRDFAKLCRGFGIVLKPPYSSQRLSRAVARAYELGSGEEAAVSLLRALKLARYQDRPLPHYALAFGRYCHFTSPIRRYPDLWVHRCLAAAFGAGQSGIVRRDGRRKGDRADDKARLESATGVALSDLARETAHLAEHCSIRERAAERAERELKTFRHLEFVRDSVARHPERAYRAVVRDVDENGLAVEIEGFWIRVRVPTEKLPGEGYRFIGKRRTLAARRGRSYRVRDRVMVRIEDVDLVAMEVTASVARG